MVSEQDNRSGASAQPPGDVAESTVPAAGLAENRHK